MSSVQRLLKNAQQDRNVIANSNAVIRIGDINGESADFLTPRNNATENISWEKATGVGLVIDAGQVVGG